MILKEDRLVDTYYDLPEYDIGYHVWYVDPATGEELNGEITSVFFSCKISDDGRLEMHISYGLDNGCCLDEADITDYIENDLVA